MLDLDETLIHYEEDEAEEEGKVHFRPFLEPFLEQMSLFYNLIIFTASLKDYADPILNYIDPDNLFFKKRYYREHTINNLNSNLKDLSILNLDLSKVIIVDNIPENFERQKKNGIFIKSWYSDEKDTALQELIPFLRNIVQREVKDVRDFLEEHRQQMINHIQRGSVTPSFDF